MTTETFFASLSKARPDVMRLKAEERCTNNAWGFGGWIGTATAFLLDGARYEYRHGKTYFRHLKPSPYFMVVSYDLPAHFRALPEAFLESL